MTRIHYFAYGSNMSLNRLRERVPGCEVIGLARLPRHQLRFHKRSDKDGSAKCDAYHTGDETDFVIGVLFSIPADQRRGLDRAEGAGYGYQAREVDVLPDNGNSVHALTYLATESHIDPALPVFGWYHDFVLNGARENGLPSQYITDRIESVAIVSDPDTDRDRLNRQVISRG